MTIVCRKWIFKERWRGLIREDWAELNAEEEPETYHYPKDPEFRKKFGPRGVIRSSMSADGKHTIEDTGPMTRKRMETADDKFRETALEFIERAVKKEKKPFFTWVTGTRMHVWTRLKKESQGVTGVGLYADGMVEHDGHVGLLLNKLDELGITPFHGEKGTTWEGGFRAPCVVRWPGTIKPGTKGHERSWKLPDIERVK